MLEHCRKMRNLSELSDESMVNELRTHMLDYNSPNPSVETLLHGTNQFIPKLIPKAFFPHKFIDHSHADAILAIVDQPNAEEVCKKVKKIFYSVNPRYMVILLR